MAAIPADCLWLEVAVDRTANVAHRRGRHAPAAPREETATWRNGKTSLPDKYAPKCRPAEPPALPTMSAYTADRAGAEACPEAVCFGPERD